MRKILLLGLAATLPLVGCYVIPLDQHGRPANTAYSPVPTIAIQPAAPSAITLLAKLYPANDQASATGTLLGQVVNHLNGHGTFSVSAGGESFTGEATRAGQNSNQGNANAVGSRGGFVRCRYVMNTTSQGTGDCTFSNGARYTMHLSG